MILAIDTSTGHLSLALYNGSEVLGESTMTSPFRHTSALAPAVRQMLTDLETDEKKLKAIAVAIGPGSFTSLRVGLSFAKGFSLGLGIPVIGVPTLDVIAAQQPVSCGSLCAFLQAGRGKLATCFYKPTRNQWESCSEINVHTVDSLCASVTEETLLCGEFNAELRAAFRKGNKLLKQSAPSLSLRRAGFLAELGWKIYEKGEYPATSSLSPIYLHTNDPIPGSL